MAKNTAQSEFLTAEEFVQWVKEEQNNHWKNSDMMLETEKLMEQVAAHFEQCEECRQAFDDMCYEFGYLMELESLFVANPKLTNWVCDE